MLPEKLELLKLWLCRRPIYIFFYFILWFIKFHLSFPVRYVSHIRFRSNLFFPHRRTVSFKTIQFFFIFFLQSDFVGYGYRVADVFYSYVNYADLNVEQIQIWFCCVELNYNIIGSKLTMVYLLCVYYVRTLRNL